MSDEPMTAQEVRALAANAQIVEAELAAARVALADAGAREAALAGALREIEGALDTGDPRDEPLREVALFVLASPSAAAEGFRLAKALADAVVYVPAKGVRCPVCEDYPTVIGANCVEEYHRSDCELDAYNTHEEASR